VAKDAASAPAITGRYHSPMKLSALHALVTAVDEGSLRNAARKLGLSQPALTKMVRELERELAAVLLVRTTQGVLPTAQGKVLVERARNVGRELAAASDQISQLSGHMVGQLAVAAVPVAVMLLMPETLRTFRREFPQVQLRVREELYLAQLQLLRTGAVDVAVGGVPRGLPSGEFIIESLLPTSMVVVVRRGHPLAGARSLKELGASDWVYTGANADEGYAKTLFEAHGLPPPPVGAVVNSTLALLSLVATGDFVGLMPVQITRHPQVAPHLAVVPVVEGGLPLEVAAMVRREATLSPMVRHFIAHLHRAAHQAAKGPRLGEP
jgi:LysR family transcriptional regulator, regulator of abg operon